jgi:hypothetical protein
MSSLSGNWTDNGARTERANVPPGLDSPLTLETTHMAGDYDLRRRALAKYDARIRELQDEYFAAQEHARQEYRDDLMAIRWVQQGRPGNPAAAPQETAPPPFQRGQGFTDRIAANHERDRAANARNADLQIRRDRI